MMDGPEKYGRTMPCEPPAGAPRQPTRLDRLESQTDATRSMVIEIRDALQAYLPELTNKLARVMDDLNVK